MLEKQEIKMSTKQEATLETKKEETNSTDVWRYRNRADEKKGAKKRSKKKKTRSLFVCELAPPSIVVVVAATGVASRRRGTKSAFMIKESHTNVFNPILLDNEMVERVRLSWQEEEGSEIGEVRQRLTAKSQQQRSRSVLNKRAFRI